MGREESSRQKELVYDTRKGIDHEDSHPPGDRAEAMSHAIWRRPDVAWAFDGTEFSFKIVS